MSCWRPGRIARNWTSFWSRCYAWRNGPIVVRSGHSWEVRPDTRASFPLTPPPERRCLCGLGMRRGPGSTASTRGIPLVAAILWTGAQELLNNHDATWASYSEIHLNRRQVETLRECWRRHGIPADLYIPGQSMADRTAAFKAMRDAS